MPLDMLGEEAPEYIHLDGDATPFELATLIDALQTSGVSQETRELFETLASVEPHYRLALNLKKALNILAEHRVADVLREGLNEKEAAALIELDRLGFDLELRTTARILLSVKERWVLSRALSGLFAHARGSCSFILLEEGDDQQHGGQG